MAKNLRETNVFFTNKKLIRHYQLVESLVTGIVLQGWETRAIFANQFVLENSFAIIRNQEMFLLNFVIVPIDIATCQSPKTPPHKLLLTKPQLQKWGHQKKQFHYTIIPTHLLLKNGKIKVRLALAKGRKRYQTKQMALEREWQKKRRHQSERD